MALCPNCGAQVAENIKFCANCGTQTISQQPEQYSSQQYGAPQPQYPPQQQYGAPQPQYPPQQYGAPQPQYPPQQPQYGVQQYPPPQQQYGVQQQYPPPQYPASSNSEFRTPNYPPTPPARKRKGLKILLIILGCFVLLIVGIIVVASLATGSTARQDFIKIGKDEVPSVKYILGEERDVIGVSSSTSNGIRTKVIEYSVGRNQNEEMRKYAVALCDDYGFYRTTDNDFSGSKGVNFEFTKKSVQDGYLVSVRIDYNTSGYTLTISQYKGTLTPSAAQTASAGVSSVVMLLSVKHYVNY